VVTAEEEKVLWQRILKQIINKTVSRLCLPNITLDICPEHTSIYVIPQEEIIPLGEAIHTIQTDG
jgi:hypothetical protein